MLGTGWIAGCAFIIGTLLMGAILEDYSIVSQTVSEIGQQGSSLEATFRIFSLMIGILLILFAVGILQLSRKKGLSLVPGISLLTFGLAEFGIGIFASPHPLHNVFGLSLTIGYFSPLMFFLLWKSKLGSQFKWISLLIFFLVIIGIFLNLSPLFTPDLYDLHYYGLVQRFLLYTFYAYCAYVSLQLLKHSVEQSSPMN